MSTESKTDLVRCRLLDIEAWRYGEGWTWNNWFNIDDNVTLPESTLGNTRRLLKWMRDAGHLTDASKGRVAVDDDGHNVVILEKTTREPLLALCYGEFQ